MTMDRFAEYLLMSIPKALPDGGGYTVRINRVRKNNGKEYTSLNIRREGVHISPAIYLEHYYEEYRAGLIREGRDREEKVLSRIRDHIVSEYRTAMELAYTSDIMFDVGSLEAMKDRLFFRLINYERNREMLEGCPHVRVSDLALTFRWMAAEDPDSLASALVTDRIMKEWDISLYELAALCRENTCRLFPPVIMPMEDLLTDMGEMTLQDESVASVRVLTNRTGVNGASAMIYEGCLEQAAMEAESDLYILPSSIHEVLLVPRSRGNDPASLAAVVREVNRTVLDPEDFLSDSLYVYEQKEGVLRQWRPAT